MDNDYDNQPLYNFLVLKGGGARGFIHLGVTMALNDLGLLDNIDMIGGTSAGAIAALLISTGWPSQRIQTELDALDLREMVCQEWSFLAPYHLYWHLGMHSGDKLTAWFEKIIESVTGNPQATFLDWHEKKMELDKAHSPLRMKHLYMEACNIETGFNEEFSHTSVHYDVPIALALSASMAYPGYFTPKTIKGKKYSDGGMQSDCPISLFEHVLGQVNPKMLPVWLDSLDRLRYIIHGEQPVSMKVETLTQFAYANAVALYNVQLKQLMSSPYKDKFIYCDTLDVDTMEFALSPLKQSNLIDSGYYGVVRFFLLQHPELAKRTFDRHLLEQIIKMNYPISVEEFKRETILVDFNQEPVTVSMTRSKKLPIADDAEAIEELYQNWCYLPVFKHLSSPKNNLEAETQSALSLETEQGRGWCRLM